MIEYGENCEFSLLVARLGHKSHLLGDDFKSHDSILILQKLYFILGTNLITIGVKNQAPQVSFKNFAAGNSIPVSSHEFVYMVFFYLLDILDTISYYVSHIAHILSPWSNSSFSFLHGHILISSKC